MGSPAFRPARGSDLTALVELERAASQAALAHVFPPDRYPYPVAAVRDRWADVLADPGVHVDVVDTPEGPSALSCFVAYDDHRLRHLGVAPSAWGRGLGAEAVRHAEDRIRVAGSQRAVLWVLADNTRARRLYERLGWQPTGREQRAEFSPYPLEVEYGRAL